MFNLHQETTEHLHQETTEHMQLCLDTEVKFLLLKFGTNKDLLAKKYFPDSHIL
jgi:hypothetical protein